MTMEPHYRHCLELIQNEDAGYYAALLFLKENYRPHVAAIHAFDMEIGRIALLVSEAAPGEIRLQWWRDVINGERDGEAFANPVARALLETILTKSLQRDGFLRYLDARVFDLYNDPMPDQNTLEAYLGETDSFILQMSALCCEATQDRILADACGHGGVAIGISRILSRLPYDRNRQRVYLPADILSATGLDEQNWLSQANQPHYTAVEFLTSLGLEHLEKARIAISALPKPIRQTFLPLAFAKARLSRASNGKIIVEQGIVLSPLGCQLALWKTILMGGHI